MRQWMVDAFAREPFKGNPACVLEPFDAWPDAGWMQALAAENNQSETAFLLKTAQPGRFGLRWFTPTVEVPLCGHATLAAGHVLFSELDVGGESVTFDTQAGSLVVRQTESGYAMDFPQDQPTPAVSPGLAEALGAEPVELYAGRFLLAVLNSEAEVRGLKPDIGALRTLGSAAGLPGDVVVAAAADPGSAFDVVDRVFAPASGIQEDPATGSAHCLLAPVFAGALGRASLRFLQAYPGRGAEIGAEVSGDRVILRGEAVTVVVGRLRLRA